MQGLSAPSFLCASLALASAAHAQAGLPRPCNGQAISRIEIITRSPYEGNGGQWWSAPLRTASQLHVTTQPGVVRRFLLQFETEPCSERLRSESERLLRAQPFIGDARIEVLADTLDGVIWRVTTTDELTTIVSIRADTDAPWLTGLTLGEGNVGGAGMLVQASWRDGADRHHWGARVVDYQVMGYPWIMEVSGSRRDVGYDEYGVSLMEPFLTDERQAAWRVSVARRSELFDFYRGDEAPFALSLTSEFGTLGGLMRIGRPGRLALLGMALTHERSTTAAPPPSRRLAELDYDSIASPFAGRSNSRVNVLWGFRMVEYLRVERFDALNGVQDMQRGAQVGFVFGRSLPALGSREEDVLVATDLYVGGGSHRRFISLQARGEGRHNRDASEWDGMLASATLTLHHRLHPRHTLTAQANWSGGWHQLVPFQLPLGSRDGGVRGYRDSRDAGGRRAVVSLEDRWYLGSVRRQADLAVAAFIDAGAVRAGDAPYGVDSPVRVGAGVALLGAFPPGSRRTWRVDLAAPLSPDPHAGWEVRMSVTNILRSWREPPEVTRSREQAVPIGLFSWP